MKNLGKQINVEVTTDVKILKDIGTNIDKTHNKMEKIRPRLDQFMERSSNTCLLLIIVVEILIFILLIAII